jgi:glycosyltransferase involved in cell wall biosynthesis
MKRAVSTFHDLFVITGEYSTPEFRTRFRQQAIDAAKRSDLIIAVSAFTASQVSSLLGVEPSRLRVIHHGVHLPARLPDESQREEMILHVGAIQRRKNVERLLAAFEALPGNWRLVLAGSAGYGAAEIMARIQASPARERIQVMGYVSATALTELYAKAGIFAFPSLDEGFGMPVLDAMAWGLPVVTSDGSAMPEVAGNAALLVDPTSVESIESGLQSLISNPELRRACAAKGLQRVKEFNWRSAVSKTWAVYEELVR